MHERYTEEELQEILENHAHWLKEDCDGWEDMRANLREADLSRANLCGAVLCGANLYGADLYRANLYGADLNRATLIYANLYGANLYRANLRGANLRGANLCGADLCGADLREADLREADLREADLREAKNIPLIPMVCPEDGEFIGWKKCKLGRGESAEYCIVKLRVPADAKRFSATGRKCRCDKAEILTIESINGDAVYTEARSDYDYEFIYKVGETVSVDNFDENRFNECAPGIHFFIDRQEAVDYRL